MKNLMAKKRPADNPYEIWKTSDGWICKVLKKYKSNDYELGARWLVTIYNPTFGSWSGESDTYAASIMQEYTKS